MELRHKWTFTVNMIAGLTWLMFIWVSAVSLLFHPAQTGSKRIANKENEKEKKLTVTYLKTHKNDEKRNKKMPG